MLLFKQAFTSFLMCTAECFSRGVMMRGSIIPSETQFSLILSCFDSRDGDLRLRLGHKSHLSHTQWLVTWPQKTLDLTRSQGLGPVTFFFSFSLFSAVTRSDELNFIPFSMGMRHYPCAICTTISNTEHALNSLDIAILCSQQTDCHTEDEHSLPT